MAATDKRSVTLSPEFAEAVEAAVEAGEYASPEEAVEDALRRWQEQRVLSGYTLEELRQLVQEGIESGPGRGLSMDEIKAEARRRFERAQRRA